MQIVQSDIYHALRAIGISERQALKAAATLNRRKNRAMLQARANAAKWALGLSFLAAAALALHA